MNLSERLKELRANKQWTQGDLAKYSGVSLDSIKGYESGKTKNITVENLQKIAIAFGLNVNNFYSKHLSLSQNPKMSPSQSDFVPKLSLSGNNLKESDKSNDNEEENEIISIPYFEDTYASAGDGVINYDEAPTTLDFNEIFLRGFLGIRGDLSRIHIINARGDSMQPTIDNGELLFVRAADRDGVTSGNVYVINYCGDVFVKRLEKNPITRAITLFSDNEKYEPIVIDGENLENCNIVGRVVAHIRKGSI